MVSPLIVVSINPPKHTKGLDALSVSPDPIGHGLSWVRVVFFCVVPGAAHLIQSIWPSILPSTPWQIMEPKASRHAAADDAT